MYLKRQRKSAERKHWRQNAQRWKTIWPLRETDTQTGCLVLAIFSPWLLPFLRPHSTISWVPWDIPLFKTKKPKKTVNSLLGLKQILNGYLLLQLKEDISTPSDLWKEFSLLFKPHYLFIIHSILEYLLIKKLFRRGIPDKMQEGKWWLLCFSSFLILLSHKNRNEWRLIYRGDWIHIRPFFELQNWIKEVLKDQHIWQLPKTSIFEDSAFQNCLRMAFVTGLSCVSD